MLTKADLEKAKEKIGVIGLGYVGLPLAALLAQKYKILGFDVNATRIDELRRHLDRTGEVDEATLKKAAIEYTDDPKTIADCRLVIVTVPTPIDAHRIPDLSPVESATRTIGTHMQPGTVVVYESTVYPGVTEEVVKVGDEGFPSWKVQIPSAISR